MKPERLKKPDGQKNRQDARQRKTAGRAPHLTFEQENRPPFHRHAAHTHAGAEAPPATTDSRATCSFSRILFARRAASSLPPSPAQPCRGPGRGAHPAQGLVWQPNRPTDNRGSPADARKSQREGYRLFSLPPCPALLSGFLPDEQPQHHDHAPQPKPPRSRDRPHQPDPVLLLVFTFTDVNARITFFPRQRGQVGFSPFMYSASVTVNAKVFLHAEHRYS